MKLILKAISLEPNPAEALKAILAPGLSNRSADAVISHVLQLGAKFAVLEHPYTDQDYSADYKAFYSGAFKSYPRYTKRLHFFRNDPAAALEGDFAAQAEALEQQGYLGFVVVRPISQGPIGRTVLAFPRLDGLTVRPAARAEFTAHILGAPLHVTGAPFIQQEHKVGACAQAAIWMASLAVHRRHRRTAWHSMAEITRLASTPTDPALSQALPAGSNGLNPAHMIRAFAGMGHQPLFDMFQDENGHALVELAEDDRGEPVPEADGVSVEAARRVLRYLDSGLPVVLTLQVVDHAVAAVGYVEAPGGSTRDGVGYEIFARALVIHDDQRGPYRLMPLSERDIAELPRDRLLMDGGDVLTADRAITHMFVPLPARVYLSGERADKVARDFLTQQADLEVSARLLENLPGVTEAGAASAAAFYRLYREGGVVQRTYLTSAARYRHHLSKSDASPVVKKHLLQWELPHYVWVTELLARDAEQAESDGPRRVLGHLVTNATSASNPDNDLLAAHTPHVVVHRDFLAEPDAKLGQEYRQLASFIADDHPYRGRVRI